MATVLTLSACSSDYAEPPEKLAIGIGLESVTDPETDWTQLRERFDTAGVDALTISIGRPEWAGFPWHNQEDHWAPAIAAATEQDRDLVGEAIKTLTTGTDRTVTLTIDVLSPLAISEDPDARGAFPDGSAAEDFPSATALYAGEIGENLVAMCHAASQRYLPDRLAVTELLGDTFFSKADEELFTEMTGKNQFPRTDDHDVDVTDPTVNQWQSTIVTDLLQRCGESAGVPVEMDARVNWEDPATGRPDSGHRYQDIYDTGAHLTLWAYTGLASVAPESAADLATAMSRTYTAEENNRTTISTGLWAGDNETLSPDELVTAIGAAASASGGPREVLITPLSLITDEHWDAITTFTAE